MGAFNYLSDVSTFRIIGFAHFIDHFGMVESWVIEKTWIHSYRKRVKRFIGVTRESVSVLILYEISRFADWP